MIRLIFVTGTTSGLGYTISQGLISETTKVYAINKKGCNLATFHGIEKAKMKISDVSWAYRNSEKEMHLINNAGVFVPDKGKDLKLDRDMVHINLIAPYRLTSYALGNFDSVINIASVSGIKGEEDAALYAATKAGLINLTKSFAKLGKTKTRVNCISPGFIRGTNLVPGGDNSVFPKKGEFGYPTTKEEILNVVEMLMNVKSFNGANIIIDGGFLL